MKKNEMLLVLVALIATGILLLSCSGKNGKKEYELKPATTSIKGDLSNYFTIVDGVYKLEKLEGKYNEFKIKVQLKRNDNTFDFDPKKIGSYNSDVRIYLYCDLLEDNGTPVIIGKTLDGCINEPTDLINLKSGETGWLEFSYSTIHDNSEFEKAKSFAINSEVKKPDATSSNSSSSSESVTSSSSSSTDCDQFIKDYAEFVNSYIKILKKYKANPSDPDILTDYTEAAKKATEMQTNAASCTDPQYASKLLDLNNKLAKAAL